MAYLSSSLFGLSQEALDICAREPIHIPGSIQPQGALLVLTPTTLAITQVSMNSADVVGHEPQQLLGLPLATLCGQPLVDEITVRLAASAPGIVTPCLVELIQMPDLPPLLGLFHTYDSLVLLELLPALADTPSLFQIPIPWHIRSSYGSHNPAADQLVLAQKLTRIITGFATDTPIRTFCHLVANQVRDLTGYDRVMIYQFDDLGHGEVIAEARRDDMEPYLGLHYPASDIPPQARQLYLNTRVRAISDVGYTPCPLVPRINPVTGRSTDLSFCLLRSVSPMHLEYLQNMGVRATMVISIIRDQQLWGLIACHHTSPKWPSQAMRMTADMLAELISVHLSVGDASVRTQAAAHAQQISHDLIRQIAHADTWFSALADAAANLLGIVDADGVAVCRYEHVVTSGFTPDVGTIHRIVQWLRHTQPARVVSTAALAELFPEIAPLTSTVCGLLAMEITRSEGGYVCWFRREEPQVVTWAGNPGEHPISPQGQRVSPRQSFAAWSVELQGHSRRWDDTTIRMVELLRESVVDVVLDMLAVKQQFVERDLLRIRAAVESASDPILIVDSDGILIFLNEACTRLLGFQLDQLRAVGGLAVLVASEHKSGDLITTLQRAHGSWHGEVSMHNRSGELLPITLRADPIRDSQGNVIGQIQTLTDLRTRRQAEAERQRLDAHMLQMQKLESLGVLAGGIAHDFNNLLTGILGYANLAMLDLDPAAPVREHVRRIELSSTRAAELCQQLLAYSGRGQFAVAPLNLNELVDEMRQLVYTVISKNASLILNLAPSLPLIEADASQIRQVVLNLLTNASDALQARPGQILVTTALVDGNAAYLESFLSLDPLPPKQYVALDVTDSGAGMDTATQARIFDPFFTTKVTGRGLGLAAVQGIVRGHGGAVRVSSRPGNGTTFTILFPATIQVATPRPSERPATPVQATTTQRGTVLVVDDDADVRAFARRLLERVGFGVIIAEHGLQAIDLFTNRLGPIRMVILDLTMPHLNGIETFQELQRIDPNVRAVLCSGYNVDEASIRFHQIGIREFVQKPYRMADLLSAIDRALA